MSVVRSMRIKCTPRHRCLAAERGSVTGPKVRKAISMTTRYRKTLGVGLCAAASYIAVPAVQRMAIPEASPTLPLAASLGLTFSYNVTIGIPVYIMIATAITRVWPVIAR